MNPLRFIKATFTLKGSGCKARFGQFQLAALERLPLRSPAESAKLLPCNRFLHGVICFTGRENGQGNFGDWKCSEDIRVSRLTETRKSGNRAAGSAGVTPRVAG